MNNTLFELWRERTDCRITCTECKATETGGNWWTLKKFKRHFSGRTNCNSVDFKCRACKSLATSQEDLVTPVKVIVNLEGLEETINYLVGAAMNNAGKRATSLVGTAKQVRLKKGEVPQEEQSLELNVRIK